jgi:hypothetical protein
MGHVAGISNHFERYMAIRNQQSRKKFGITEFAVRMGSTKQVQVDQREHGSKRKLWK